MDSLKEREGLHLACPACAGGLLYDISTEGMRCTRCGKQYEMADIQDPSSEKADYSDQTFDAIEYHCPQCGAALYAYENAGVSRCVFCGSDVILEERLSKIQKPDLILPFHITREECVQIYRKRIKRALFAPKAMLAEDTVHGFQPIYIPFWLYSGKGCDTGTAIVTEVTRDGNKKITSTYSHSLDISVSFDRIYYDASSAFDDETAIRLSLEDKDLRSFHAGYLCGCYAEAPDVESDIYREVIVEQANTKLQANLKSRHFYGKTNHFKTDIPMQKKLVMMPVWMMADRQKSGKVLYTAINGRNGRIVCDTPVGKGRFAILAVLFTLLFLAVMLWMDSAILIRSRLLAGICGMLTAFAAWMISPETKKMLLRKKDKDDPTRTAVSESNNRPSSGKKPRVRLKTLPFYDRKHYSLTAFIIFSAAVIVYTVLAFLITRNARAPHVAFVSSYIDDGAFFPVFLILVSAGMLYWQYLQLWSVAGRKIDYLLLFWTELLAAAGMLIYHSDYVNYGICIVFLVITCLMMWIRFRHHNEYVTRPVPFFGKEEQA